MRPINGTAFILSLTDRSNGNVALKEEAGESFHEERGNSNV
jgi:hypothetical protein